MPDHTRTLTQRVAAAAGLIVTLAAPVAAQQAGATSPTAGFMTRYDFHLDAASLAIHDPRFSWDTHFGGEVDMVDYVYGRASVLIDYEAVLGDEFRAFDPNQGNYILETSASVRVAATETAFVFHHVSRHLSDRPKRFPIAWNSAGVRLQHRASVAGTTLDVRAHVGRTLQHSYVDYTWIGELDLTVRRSLVPRAAIFVHGNGQLIGIDASVAHRGSQQGGLAEAGIRIEGRAGTIELFAGVERRVDADPLDRQARQWGFAGFRLLSH
jgi:hypothetical protein